jgi:hypothetical protein
MAVVGWMILMRIAPTATVPGRLRMTSRNQLTYENQTAMTNPSTLPFRTLSNMRELGARSTELVR